MKAFGLVGTWSVDCAIRGAPRWIYAGPLFGAPTIRVVQPLNNGAENIRTSEIRAAVRVTEDKLKLTGVLVDLRSPGFQMRPDELANQTLKDSVIVKAGNKISFFDDSGKPLGNSLEKCLN